MMLERSYDQWLPGLCESAGDSKVTCPDEANQTHPLPNFGSVLSHFQVNSLGPFPAASSPIIDSWTQLKP